MAHLWLEQRQGALDAVDARAPVHRNVVEDALVVRQEGRTKVVPATQTNIISLSG